MGVPQRILAASLATWLPFATSQSGRFHPRRYLQLFSPAIPRIGFTIGIGSDQLGNGTATEPVDLPRPEMIRKPFQGFLSQAEAEVARVDVSLVR